MEQKKLVFFVLGSTRFGLVHSGIIHMLSSFVTEAAEAAKMQLSIITIL